MQIGTVCGGPPVHAEAASFLRGLMQRPAARQLLRVLRRPMTAQWPTGRQPVIVCLQSSRAFFIPPPSPSPSRQALLALAADAPAPPPTLAGPAPVPELQVKAPTYTAKPFLQFPPLSPQARRRGSSSVASSQRLLPLPVAVHPRGVMRAPLRVHDAALGPVWAGPHSRIEPSRLLFGCNCGVCRACGRVSPAGCWHGRRRLQV